MTTTSDQPRQFNLQDAIALLNDAIVSRMRMFITIPRAQDANIVATFLDKVKTDMRFYTLNARDLQTFWNDIRENEEFLPTAQMEFLLDITVDFVAYYLSSEGVVSPDASTTSIDIWVNLLSTLAKALASPRNALTRKKVNDDLVVSDPEFRDRGLNEAEWVEFLDNNRWALVLVLWKLSREDSVSIMLRAGFRAQDAKRGSNHAPTPAGGA